jgi:hypothetical protein
MNMSIFVKNRLFEKSINNFNFNVFLPLLYSQKTPENGYKNQTFAKIKILSHDNLMSLKFFYTLIMSV